MNLQPGVRLGHYEVLSALGAGGMGEVWRARDRRLDREVALKVLPAAFVADPQRLARFEREAKVLASLNHPHIGGIYGLEEAQADGGAVRALVLELVEGPTLADRIARGSIPVDEALPMARQIAEALEAAHEQGVVHRDLKPANVKIRPDGKVKVLDFGLAKALEPALQAAAVGATGAADLSHSPTLTLGAAATQLGVILGTAAYMAPEQARGRPVDKRADVWAFGCVLYEMLTGERAFRGEDVSMTLAEVMKGVPAWSRVPDSVPAAVRRLLRRCLEKDPQRRLRDIGEARILLDELIAGGAGAGDPVTEIFARRPWGWITSTAGLGLIAGVLVIAMVATRTASRPDHDRVLRYSIPLPKNGLTFSHEVSPDGRHVAIQAGVDQSIGIFVKALDSLEGFQPLSVLGGAGNFFWSPDGRYLAFFAQQKLMRVSVNGGPADELCDVSGYLDPRGSWGTDDVIVFAASSRFAPGPLRVVPASGGEAKPLTTVEPGESHRFPVFLPDGRHFLYTSLGGPRPGIYVASLDDLRGRRILTDASSVHVPSVTRTEGVTHLLFVRDGKLMAQRFDVDRLDVTGEPLVVLQDARFDDDGRAAVSISDDGTLVYRGGGQRDTHSRFTWFDRAGLALTNEGLLGAESPVSLSPNGRMMTFVKRTPGKKETVELFLRDLSRDDDSRFTYQNAVDVASNHVWSRDGSRVVFSANTGGKIDLFWQDVSSSGSPRVLLETANPTFVMDWSRDGRYLIYTEMDPRTRADLWYLPLEPVSDSGLAVGGASVPFLQTEFTESAAQLSPDGRWVAYTSDESGSDVPEVYVRPFPEGAGKWKVSMGRSHQPRWRSDGRELFYLTGPRFGSTLMSVDVTAARPGSSDAPPLFEFEDPKTLFETRANAYFPAWGAFFYAVSADGQRFLINRMDFAEEPVLNVVTNWRRAFGVAP
jgi:Tol biopolymer transport system component